MADGPSVESEIWQHYLSTNPGEVMLLGADVFNGTFEQLDSFKNTIGATFPLLLNGAAGSGSENLLVTYGDRDNYAVINKTGVVRYNAYNLWPYGNRYHVNQLRGCIDSLVSPPVGVGPGAALRGAALTAAPNPFRSGTTIELGLPAESRAAVRVSAFDLAGREVARLSDAPLPAGVTPIAWDGRGTDGTRLPPGVYVICARLADFTLARRVLLVR